MKAFCVIPHSARESAFFEAVYEDGIRVAHQGRILSLPFTRVLSPAHNLFKHLLSPLLESVRDGRPAMLVTALQAADTTLGASGGGGASEATSSHEQCFASLEDCSTVTLELYARLLPLLFHNVPACPQAEVSVLSLSAHDRVVIDELQGKPCRSLGEVSRGIVPRESSVRQWGGVLQILADRHDAVMHARDSLAAQLTCVVVVALEGGSRVVLVDCSCDQDILQAITLILSMNGVGGERTYPPCTPLREVLEGNLTPDGIVHVLAVPEPTSGERNTMRILRFASGLAAGEVEVGSPPCVPRASNPKEKLQEPHSQHSRLQELQKTSSASHTAVGRDSRIVSLLAAYRSPDASIIVGPEPHQHGNSNSSGLGYTPSPLPPPATQQRGVEVQRGLQQHHVREQHLLNRIRTLERKVHDAAAQQSTTEKARAAVEEQASSLQRTLRSAERRCHEAQTSLERVERERKTLSARVSKLTARLESVTGERDTLLEAKRHSIKKTRNLQDALKEADETITHLRAVQRSQAAQWRHLVDAAAEAEPPETHLSTVQSHVAAAASSNRIAAVALDELRRRNDELETTVAALLQGRSELEHQLSEVQAAYTEVSVAHAACSTVTDDRSRTQLHCEHLEDQLRHCHDALSLLRKERASYLRPLASHERPAATGGPCPVADKPPTQPQSAGRVHSIILSMIAGCSSLEAQLNALASGDVNTDVSGGLPKMVAEHLEAVRTLAAALEAIHVRRWGNEALPECDIVRMATAADVSSLTKILRFEHERLTHLQAFVPTFAQLCVAVEHLSMRRRQTNGVRSV